MTDSANCYSSIISGRPENEDTGVGIQLSFVWDLRDCLSLTFIDQIFNLAESMAKTVNWHHLSVRRFLLTSYFRVGFLGRKEIRNRRQEGGPKSGGL